MAARIADTKIGDVVIYACVLPWIGSPWRGVPSAGGRAFGAALDTYREDWKRLNEMFPQAVLIVAGDFNQDLATRHYYGSRDQRKALRAALDEAKLDAATAGDWIQSRSTRPRARVSTTSASHVQPSSRLRIPSGGLTNRLPSAEFRIILAWPWM